MARWPTEEGTNLCLTHSPCAALASRLGSRLWKRGEVGYEEAGLNTINRQRMSPRGQVNEHPSPQSPLVALLYGIPDFESSCSSEGLVRNKVTPHTFAILADSRIFPGPKCPPPRSDWPNRLSPLQNNLNSLVL